MEKWIILPITAFADFTQQWDELNERLYRSHPMLDSRFVRALINHFASTDTYLAVYPANLTSPDNLLLLQPAKPGVWQTFLPSQAQIAPVLCGFAPSLVDLPGALPGLVLAIDLLCQDPLYSFSTDELNALEVINHVTTINIDLHADFAAYWQQRSKNLKHNINRYFKRLSKNATTYQINVINKADQLLQALDRYGELESSGWKGATGTAINSQNVQGRFYAELLLAFAATNQAEIVEISINGQLAASRMLILNGDMLIIVKTTYDEQLAVYAPGRLLLYLLIEREFTLKRVQTIEFYTNATIDQIGWCTGQRDIKHLMLYRSIGIHLFAQRLRTIKTVLSKRCSWK